MAPLRRLRHEDFITKRQAMHVSILGRRLFRPTQQWYVHPPLVQYLAKASQVLDPIFLSKS